MVDGRELLRLAILICCGCSAPDRTGPRMVAAPKLPASGRVLDLTHPLIDRPEEQGLLAWSGDDPAPPHRPPHRPPEESVGTVVEAPSLLLPDGRSAAELDTGVLIGPAVVIDLRPLLSRGDPDVVITEQGIVSFEKQYGPLPAGCFVLLLSGWDDYFDRPEIYLNQDAEGEWHFPGFSAGAVSFLVRERDIRAIGVDTPSVDQGLNTDLDAHRALFAAGKYAIENLRGLDRLPATGATLIVAPVPIWGAARAPARVLALVSR